MTKQKRSAHGNTPAAWTTVSIAFIGFSVGCLGVLRGESNTFWAGVIVFCLSGLVGKLMQKAGYGQYPRS